MPYRLIYLGLGLVAVAAIAFGLVFSAEGESVELPEPVEKVLPAPGDLVPPQAVLEIDLKVGYEAQITVDGWPINDAQFVEATGVYRWSPSPTHPTITEWIPGDHTVSIVYTTYTGTVDTGSFEWTFRVG
ncbi:MAG TPA: hypothetical protein VE569_07400 [Acidimicrobiia bacterium]|nr:hypothetical protein [Acidimicrobiia bacterium]